MNEDSVRAGMEARGHLATATPAVAAARSASFERRARGEDSWVEISSQPSSSSLSSVGEEGVRGQHNPRARRRRTLRPNDRGSNLNAMNRSEDGSSQEEYDESESESDRVMTSSGEGPGLFQTSHDPATQGADDDEHRTAINYPLDNDHQCFTPQPNAFSHPPTGQLRTMSQPSPGSYFPAQRRESQSSVRTSLPTRRETNRTNHMPQNILSPSYDAQAHHEALRSSLTNLLSFLPAARGLQKPPLTTKQPALTSQPQPPRTNRLDPTTLRLLPESSLPENTPQPLQEPTFHPTLRRASTSTSTSSDTRKKDTKRKTPTTRSSSRERRAAKKARRSSVQQEDVSPTLLTWVVSAGVVVVLSALSFSAGYSMGKESGRLEVMGVGDGGRGCGKEVVGLKRSLARSAVQV